MEDDDDDLYEPSPAPATNGAAIQPSTTLANVKAEEQEEGEEGEASADEDESDSDIDIITERKPGTKQEPTTQTSRLDAVKAESTRPSSSDRVPSRTQIVTIKSDPAATSTSTTTARPSAAATQSHAPLTQPIGRPGHSYPGVHISSLDPNGPIPLFAPLNKPLTDLDFDADLTEHDKSWRRPGADQSDWFNYGFDEFTWATYCLRQKSMREGIEGQKAETARFETMFGGGPGPGQGGRDGSAVPGQGAQMQGVPDMGMGMPDMNAMMQQMMASGMDPSTMDFGGFMQMQQQQQQQGMGMGMGGPQQGGGFGGDGGHGGGGFGRGGGRRGRRW